jgi:putative PIN family toxin of toxin-antitoxin system
MKPEAVFDTNVLISGILWRGIPFRLLRRAEDENLTIYSSADILTEVYRVLHYPKFQKYIDRHLLSIKRYQAVLILKAEEFYNRI